MRAVTNLAAGIFIALGIQVLLFILDPGYNRPQLPLTSALLGWPATGLLSIVMAITHRLTSDKTRPHSLFTRPHMLLDYLVLACALMVFSAVGFLAINILL